MRFLRFSFLVGFCGLGFTLSGPKVCAQQQTQDQSAPPIPAYRSPLASVANNGDAEDSGSDTQTLAPDTRSLAGVQDLSLGVPPLTHSYWQPHLDITSTVDSNALNTNGNNGWLTWTGLLGGVDLHRISGNNDLTVSYIGGGVISNNGNSNNSVVQGLNFIEKLSFRRLTVSFFDQLNYSPERFYGYGGLSGLALPGGGTVGVQPGFLPGQPVLITNSQLITNSFLTQVDTYLTRRSSFTFVGGYSLLNYTTNGLLNFGDIIFQGGYNHQMKREDTLAVFYRFSGYRYTNFSQSINDNSIQASYGRRLTGKLAFQISAGPDVATFNTPISGSGLPVGAGGPSRPAVASTEVHWSLYTSLTYQLERTRLSLSYNHGLAGGVGVLAGSTSDSVWATASRALTRRFNGGFNLGYVRNKGLDVRTVTPSSRTYDYWSGGANLSHTLGRSTNLSLTYQLQYQTSSSPFCVGTTCGKNITVHLISLGLGWRVHPIVF